MTGEHDIVAAILARLEALAIALDEDTALLGSLPADLAEFSAMDVTRRVASRALLKTVEQLEDQLARLFRLIPALKLADTNTWFAQDFANYAEKLGIVEDSFAWTNMVKLRNRLVHDYPLNPEAQFDMLKQAHAAVPLLQSTMTKARSFVDGGGLDDG